MDTHTHIRHKQMPKHIQTVCLPLLLSLSLSLLRCIWSLWHRLPVCCHAAPHLALQEAPDCSWAEHSEEVINGLPYFKRQSENTGGTMQTLRAASLSFIPSVFTALCLLGPNGPVAVALSVCSSHSRVCLLGRTWRNTTIYHHQLMCCAPLL